MKHLWLPLLIASASFAARADIVVPMTLVDENGIGAPVGTVTISETAVRPGVHAVAGAVEAGTARLPRAREAELRAG